MPMAARIGDQTSHAGVVAMPGAPTVLIGGSPAATAASQNLGASCPAHSSESPCSTAFLPATAIPTVLIGGLPALVVGSMSSCGAGVVRGAPTVLIGG